MFVRGGRIVDQMPGFRYYEIWYTRNDWVRQAASLADEFIGQQLQ